MSDRFGVLDPLFKWDLSLDIVTSHADWGSSRIPSLFVGKKRFTSLNGIFMSRGGGVLHFLGYIGMCGPKGYGFSAVLFINWVSILAILPPFWS